MIMSNHDDLNSQAEKELEENLYQLWNYLICNSKDIEPEYVRIVEEHFWNLLA